MTEIQKSQYGLEDLYLFPYYQTREAFLKATGHEAPAWDPTRPPKAWEDPKASQTQRRNVVYDFVVAYAANGALLVGADYKPTLDLLVLPKDQAATVNIPPKGPNASNVPGAEVPEVAPPLRALEPNEELFMPFPGLVAVRNKDLQPLEYGFNRNDRRLLEEIAAKLGVTI